MLFNYINPCFFFFTPNDIFQSGLPLTLQLSKYLWSFMAVLVLGVLKNRHYDFFSYLTQCTKGITLNNITFGGLLSH